MRSRLKSVLLVPMLLMITSGLGYAIWTDTITIQSTLISAQAPTISVDKGFINLQHNLVTINVRTNDKVIVSTSPDVVRIFVDLTSMGATPINMVVVTDALPEDWYLHPGNVQVQLIQEDEAIIKIGKPYFTMSYDSNSRTLTLILHDVLAAADKYLSTNEKIRIMFNIDYALKGNKLPSDYENSPPTYINVATATAWIRGWSGSSITVSATFATTVNWVGR